MGNIGSIYFKDDEEKKKKTPSQVASEQNNTDRGQIGNIGYSSTYKPIYPQEPQVALQQPVQQAQQPVKQEPVVEEKKSGLNNILDKLSNVIKTIQSEGLGKLSSIDTATQKVGRKEGDLLAGAMPQSELEQRETAMKKQVGLEASSKKVTEKELLIRKRDNPIEYLVNRPYAKTDEGYLQGDVDRTPMEAMEYKLKASADFYSSLSKEDKVRILSPDFVDEENYFSVAISARDTISRIENDLVVLRKELVTATGKDQRQIEARIKELEGQIAGLEMIEKGAYNEHGAIDAVKDFFSTKESIPVIGGGFSAEEAIVLLGAYKRQQEGEELTEREKMLIERNERGDTIEYLTNNYDIGYEITSGLLGSLSMMAEFVLAGALFKAVGLGAEGISIGANATSKLARGAGAVATGVLKTGVKAGQVTLTSGVGRVVTEATERQTPVYQYYWQTGESVKTKEGEDPAEAWTKAVALEYGNNVIEVMFDGMGSADDIAKNLLRQGAIQGFPQEFSEEILQKFWEEAVIEQKQVVLPKDYIDPETQFTFTPRELVTIGAVTLALGTISSALDRGEITQVEADIMTEQLQPKVQEVYDKASGRTQEELKKQLEQEQKNNPVEGTDYEGVIEEVGTEVTTREVQLEGQTEGDLVQENVPTEQVGTEIQPSVSETDDGEIIREIVKNESTEIKEKVEEIINSKNETILFEILANRGDSQYDYRHIDNAMESVLKYNSNVADQKTITELQNTVLQWAKDGVIKVQDMGRYKTEVRQQQQPKAKETPVKSETVIPKEGEAFEFSYVRNLEKAPNMGARFGQDIEPSGRYMTVGTPSEVNKTLETGVIRFENPLVIDFGGGYTEKSNWKNVLSKRFGNKKGKELSNAIRDAGYDGIVTVSESGGTKYTSEIVDLTQPKTQKEQVKEVLAEGEAKSIKQIAEETKIKEPNIRRILGVGTKEGEFSRVAEGVYVLKTESGQVAYIETGNALESLPRLAKEGFKADMVFLDIPYDTPAVKGGNRGMKYNFITPEEFGEVLDSVNTILASENSPVIYMFSQAKSGWAKMQKYNEMLDEKGLKVIAKGEWQKRFQNGEKVTNVRGEVAQPEGILLLSQSGEIYKDIVPIDLNFDFVRPKGYQSEKNADMIKEMIQLTTNTGDVVLDPFAGSGVVPAEAIKVGRSAVAIEVDKKVVEETIKPRVEKASKEVKIEGLVGENQKKFLHKGYEFITTEVTPRSTPSPVPLDTSKKVLMLYGQTEDGWTFVENKIGLEPFTDKQLDEFIGKYKDRLIKQAPKGQKVGDDKVAMLESKAQSEYEKSWDKLTPQQQHKVLMGMEDGQRYIKTTDQDTLMKLGKGVDILSLKDTAVGDKQEIFLWGGQREGLYTDGMILFTDKPIVKKIIDKFQEQYITKYAQSIKKQHGTPLTEAKEGIRSTFTKERIDDFSFPETQPILDSAKANFKLEPIGFYADSSIKQSGSIIFRAENGTLVRISGKYYSAIKSFYPSAEFYITDESNVKPVSFVVGKSRKGIVMPMVLPTDVTFTNLVGKEGVDEAKEMQKIAEEKRDEERRVERAKELKEEDVRDDIGLGLQEYIYDGKKLEQIPTHKGKIGYLEQGTYEYNKDTGQVVATLADGRRFKFTLGTIYDSTIEAIAKSRVDGRTWMENTFGEAEFKKRFPNGIPKKEVAEDDDIAFYTTARRREQRRYDDITSMADIRRNLDILRKDRLGTKKKEYYHSTSGVRLGSILDSKVLKSESRGKISFADNLDFSTEYGDIVFVTSQINPVKEKEGTSRYGTEYVQKGEISLSKIDRILLKVNEQEGLDTRIKLDLKMSKTAGEIAFDLREMGFEVRFVVNGKEVGESYFTTSDDQLMMTDGNTSYMYKWNPKDEKSEFVYHGTSEVIRSDWKFPLYLSFNKEYADTYQRLGASSLGKIKLGGGEKTYTFKKASKERILDTRNEEHLDLLQEYFTQESVSGGFYPSERGLPDWTEAEGIAEFVENNNLPFDALLIDEGGIPDPYSEGVIDRGIGYVALNRNGILQPDVSELQAKEDESKGSQSLETYEAREVTPAEQLKMSDEVKALVHKYADKVGEKYLPRGVLGVFYGKTKEIRLKGITDLYVASHEISHAIDKKYDITARITPRDSVDMQLREAYINLYPTAKETHAVKTQKLEGFAMAVATYLQRPSSFTQEYPAIVKEMFTQGGKYYNTEIGEYLNDVSNIVSRYQSLNDLDRVATRISKSIPTVEQTLFKSKTEATVNMLQNDLNLFERWVKENGDTMTKADFTNLFRFRTQVKQIYENNIATNLSKKNVEEGKFKNFMGGLYSYIRKSVAQDTYYAYNPETKNIERKHDFNWGTLRREVAQKGVDRQFNSLLVARRAYYDFEYADKLKTEIETIKADLEKQQDELIEMYQKKEGDRNKRDEKAKEVEIAGTKVILQEVESNLAEVESLLKNDGWDRRLVTDSYLNNQGLFEKELDMFDKLVAEDILLAKNVGIISQEKYNELKDNKGYAPFKRIIYDEVLGEVDPSEISGNLKLGSKEISSLKKRTGSTKEIIYPLQSAMRNHMEFLNKSVSQDAINTFLTDRTMEMHSANIKKVEWHKGIENQKDIIIKMEDGVRKAYAVDPMIKELLSGYLSPKQVDWLEKVQQSYKQLFTMGTTGTYFQFVFTNLPRDAFNYITQTYQSNSIKAVYNLFADTAKVVLGKNPDNNLELQYFQKYLALGGREMTFIKYMEGDYDAFTTFLRQEEKGLKKIKNTVGKVAKVGLDVLSMPSQLSEMWYRSVEFIEAKKSGDSDVVALEKARRVTTPFHHRGSFKYKDSKGNITKAPNIPKYAPFQNAALQAFAWSGGNFIKDPKIRSRMIFMIALTTALGLEELLRAWSNADDDDKEQFKDLTAEDLSRFIHIPKKGGGIRRIAVAEWAGGIAGTINMTVMDFILDEVDYSVTDYATALTVAAPDQFNLLVPVIKLLEKGTWDEFGKWGTSLLPALANPIIAIMGYKTYPEFAPLESSWQKTKLPADRYNEGTSKFAKWAMNLELPFDKGRLGDFFNLSPLQLDAILTQSFGRTIGMITGKPDAWNVLKSVNREYYFEYGRRLNDYWDTKEKNDQLYNSMTKGTRTYSKEKELEVFRRKAISKDIDTALDEYKQAYDDKDIERIEKTRARVIDLVTRYNDNPSTPEMEIYLANPNAKTMEEAMRARALREISMKDPRDYTKEELADAKALAKEFRQEALLARSDYSYSELLFGITKNDDKVVKIEEVIEGKSEAETKKYLASLKYAGMISNDVIIKLYNAGVIDYELGKWANDLESNRNF